MVGIKKEVNYISILIMKTLDIRAHLQRGEDRTYFVQPKSTNTANNAKPNDSN